MKKIVHLIGQMTYGGAEKMVSDYGVHIDKKKFEYHVIVVGYERHTANESNLVENGAYIHYIDDENITYKKNFLIRLYARVRRQFRLNKLIKNIKPHIIHSHLSINNYLIPIKTKKNGVKLFHTLHNEVDVLFKEGREKYKKSTKYLIHKRGMTLISLHECMRLEACELFNTNRCIVLNNTIDVGKFMNVDIDKTSKRREIGLNEHSYVIGHIGRFAEQKNHYFIIEVFNKFLEEKPDAQLLLVGTGELLNGIREKITNQGIDDRVIILENRPDVNELLQTMDVFFFPSIYEGFGNVIIEAQAAGLKCVISDVIPKGVFVTPNVVSLGLDRPYEDWIAELQEPMTESANTDELYAHDIKNVVKELEQIYERCIC